MASKHRHQLLGNRRMLFKQQRPLASALNHCRGNGGTRWRQ
jgi:hypothetical protein